MTAQEYKKVQFNEDVGSSYFYYLIDQDDSFYYVVQSEKIEHYKKSLGSNNEFFYLERVRKTEMTIV